MKGESASSAGPFLSCRPGSFGKAQAEAYRYLAQWGVRYVEIALPDPAASAAARAELDRYGLLCGSLQVRLDLQDPGVAKLAGAAAARAQAEFSCRFLFTSVRSGPGGPPQAYAALRACGEAVGAHGVTLLVETHPDLGTNGAVTRATMEAVGHPHVRSNWDPANVFYYNTQCDPVAEFELALPWIGGVHLKDTGGGYHAWNFPALGEGVVPFPYILRRLHEVGFCGPCTMEIEGVQGENLTAEEYAARVKKSIEYLRGLGYFAAA